MSGGRNGTLVRVLRLMAKLDGTTTPHFFVDLAQEFGVSERTIRRDLYALEEAGAVIEYGRGKHWNDTLVGPDRVTVARFKWPSSRRRDE